MPLTKEQIDQFHQDGFIIVDDVFDQKDAEAAFVEMEKIFYGKSFDEYLAEFDETGVTEPVEPKTTGAISHYGETQYGRPQFPAGIEALDRLIENNDWLDMYEQCLGTQDLSYCNGHLFLRSGPTDKRHAEHPWQGYHIDNATNNFLPPHRETDLYHYVNSSIYLHDVPDDCAPMQIIPGSHHQIMDLLPKLIRDGNWAGRGGIKDIRKVPEFADPVPATGKAGSVRFNSSFGVHAAIPFENKRRQRGYSTFSFCRADTSQWIKLSNLWREQEYSVPFWKNTTPRVRSLFGWPKPGHPYYTVETLDLLSEWYPGIDLTSYQDKLQAEVANGIDL